MLKLISVTNLWALKRADSYCERRGFGIAKRKKIGEGIRAKPTRASVKIHQL